jgi:nucleoside phosphorylase
MRLILQIQGYIIEILYHRLYVDLDDGLAYFYTNLYRALDFLKTAFARLMLQEVQRFLPSMSLAQRNELQLTEAVQNGLDPRTPERQQATTLDQSPLADHLHNIGEDLSLRSHIDTPSTLGQPPLRLKSELPHVDILLVAVNKIETVAVLQAFSKTCMHEAQHHFIGDKTYYELGIVNGARVFLMRCEMGSTSPGSSLLTVHKAIQALNPSYIIMIGVAYGVDRAKQRIGDVLVSQRLCNYELQRVSTTHDGAPAIILRGDRVTASAKLLDRFRTGSLNWVKRCVHFGPILSGEKLIDNINFRDQLLTLEPEAIGGEMEGVGLYTATQSEKAEFVVHVLSTTKVI